MITAYSWADRIFQQTLPPSLTDAEKRAELVYEINTVLVKGKNGSSTDTLLKDLDTDDKNNCLNKIAQPPPKWGCQYSCSNPLGL
jgi:hypothetical protein